MTARFVVTDEQEKIFHKRRRELENRFFKKTLDPDVVNTGLQMLIEGQRVAVFEQRPESNILTLIEDWQKFLQEIFNIEADFSEAPVPKASDEFSWIACVPKGITTEQAFSGGKNQFPIKKWAEKPLDDVLDLSFGRDAQQHSYIIRLCPNIEADKDLKNLSANNIVAKQINTATLKERLLLGRFLYWKEKLILDERNITLCSGSRYSNGRVPGVRWCIGVLWVCWDFPALRRGVLRARRAVS